MESPVLEIDNFLTKNELDLVKNEIESNRDKFTKYQRDSYIQYSRWYIDETYVQDRTKSDILSIFSEKIWSADVKYKLLQKNTMSGTLHELSDWHETQVTRYTKGNEYRWHTDHVFSYDGIQNNWTGRIENWIFYLGDNDYEGGELFISDQPYYEKKENLKPTWTVKPKENKLVIMPSHMWHKVNEVKTYNKERLTINGHVGFGYYSENNVRDSVLK